jgi:hypothetical protein
MFVLNEKIIAMKKYIILSITIIGMALTWISCTDFPIDEDGLLVTDRAECYVSNFDLLGQDFQTVRTAAPAIDTVAQTINITVFYGTDLKNLWPQFSLITDAKLDPKITGYVDFSDLNNPKTWTVISGNRKVKKIYTVFVNVQAKP